MFLTKDFESEILNNFGMEQNCLPDIEGELNSYWLKSLKKPSFPKLSGNPSFDVAIIGGGIAGLSTAYFLRNSGLKVTVIEAREICHDVTGHTTAKVTSQHNLIYDYLISNFGRGKAKLYGQAQEQAIAKIAEIIEQHQIDCDFVRDQNITYTVKDPEVETLHKEVLAAKELGLPASFSKTTELPFEVKAAVIFENQARFHPLKYLYSLLKIILNSGVKIFEQTRVTNFTEGSPLSIETNNGPITAMNAVIATNSPFTNKGQYYAKMSPSRSYVLCARLKNRAPKGMYITANTDEYTFRPIDGEEKLYLIGGGPHKAGQADDVSKIYANLEKYAKETFDIEEITYRWSTQDNFTNDKIPFIGRLTPDNQNIYVATGFGGWGMTNATVAGMIISDLIQEKENSWHPVFDSLRKDPLKKAPYFIKQNTNVAKHLFSGFLSKKEKDINDIKPCQGAVINYKEHKTAASKDEKGEPKILNPHCTHMNCIVNWNNAERTWDCPCHGSRFYSDGEVYHGPANKKLEEIESKED